MLRLAHAELLNLALALRMLGKVALGTGLGPGIILFYVAEMLARVERVPTRPSAENVVSIGKSAEEARMAA